MGRKHQPKAQSRRSYHHGQKRWARVRRQFGFYVNRSGGVVLTNDNVESRRVIEQCYKRHKTTVNPIIDWTDTEVWEFIRANSIPYCDLYDDGFHRLGCIGCPMARQKGRERDFIRWPKYKNAYLLAFGKMLTERKKRGKLDATLRMGGTPQDVFNWWMEYDILPGQLTFDDYEEEIDAKF